MLQHTCRLFPWFCKIFIYHANHTIDTAAAASATAIHDSITPVRRFFFLTNHDVTHTSMASIAIMILKSALIVMMCFMPQK